MKEVLSVFFASVMLFNLVGILCFDKQAWAEKKKFIMIGSTQTSSSQFGYGVAVTKAINMHVPELNATVVETGASVDNVKRLRNGQLDIGAIVTDKVMYEAWKGIGMWKDMAVPDIRVLWIYLKAIQHFVVREDSGVKKWEDLEGKKFNPGMRGSSTEETTKQVFNILGVKPDYHIGGTSDAVAAIKDGRIVGYVKSGAGFQLDASTLDIKTMTKIRLLSMTAEQVKKVKDAIPYIPILTVPAGKIRALPNQPDYTNYAVMVFAVALKSFPEDLGYKCVKAILKEREMIISAFSPFGDVDVIKDTTELAMAPLHAGAYRAYKELGAKIPERAIPPETEK
jgi:hypothetical protein